MVRDGCRYNGSAAVVTINVTGKAPPPPPPANRAPAARFVVISNLMGAKKPINFDASISSDPDNDTLQYRFDWGDGNATDWAASKTASHTYMIPGTYNVTLTVRDAGNLTAANTTTIIVNAAPKTIAPKGFIPGPGLAAVVAVFALAGAIRRMRKRAGHRTE
jgi:PKD repeat protein